MANNTNENKRIAIKWVRDAAKSAYDKKDQCYICGCTRELELHHLQSISLLLDDWAEKRGHDISTDAGILAVRHQFIEEHHVEMYQRVHTLCNPHHVQLHKLYGAKPKQDSWPRQQRWIELQRQKHTGEIASGIIPGVFGEFGKPPSFREFTGG